MPRFVPAWLLHRTNPAREVSGTTIPVRFRRHFKRVNDDQASSLIHLDDMLLRITQDDVVQRRHLSRRHRSYVPDFGVYIMADAGGGKPHALALSRQMVLFCVERRKAWRLLQSKAGVRNLEYKAHRALLAKVDAGKISLEKFFASARKLWDRELETLQTAPSK